MKFNTMAIATISLAGSALAIALPADSTSSASDEVSTAEASGSTSSSSDSAQSTPGGPTPTSGPAKPPNEEVDPPAELTTTVLTISRRGEKKWKDLKGFDRVKAYESLSDGFKAFNPDLHIHYKSGDGEPEVSRQHGAIEISFPNADTDFDDIKEVPAEDDPVWNGPSEKENKEVDKERDKQYKEEEKQWEKDEKARKKEEKKEEKERKKQEKEDKKNKKEDGDDDA